MTANWPMPLRGMAGSRRTATRVTPGAISLEQLQPFPAQAVFELHETGGIAARPRQAVDEAGADRIGDDREHDRHGAGRLQQRPHGRACHAARMTSGASATNSAACLRMSCGIAVAQRVSIRTLRPIVQPSSLQPLQERRDTGLNSASSAAAGISTPMRRIARLLRARTPAASAAAPPSSRDEFAPLHSITSSAAACSGSGTVMPSSLAVFRLMASSNCIACCTGNSEGVSPLRMRAT